MTRFFVATSVSSLAIGLLVAAVAGDWSHWPGVWYLGSLFAFVVQDVRK